MANQVATNKVPSQSDSWVDSVGVVVIGRNEGERLRRCLESLQGSVKCMVYVDSGSTDDSVGTAKGLGTDVVDLDTAKPFSAARARNTGFARIRELFPELSYVMFVDGDCEVVDGWIETAVNFLDDNQDYAVACGRRRERYPEKTVFNRLCDMEWDSPVGEAAACGGDTIIRTDAFDKVGGYNPDIVGGEEPEMCLRLRQLGWRIYRIDHDMTLHDADMTKLSQWWMRAVRSGHAYAEGQARHGRLFGGYYARDVWSILIWALIMPILGLTLAFWTFGLSLLFVAVGYANLWRRIKSFQSGRGVDADDASLYAKYCVMAKWPQLHGILKYWKNRFLGRGPKIIEYK